MNLREAAQALLDEYDDWKAKNDITDDRLAMIDLRAALAQPEDKTWISEWECNRRVAAERERCAQICDTYANALEKLVDAGGELDGDRKAIDYARALARSILNAP